MKLWNRLNRLNGLDILRWSVELNGLNSIASNIRCSNISGATGQNDRVGLLETAAVNNEWLLGGNIAIVATPLG